MAKVENIIRARSDTREVKHVSDRLHVLSAKWVHLLGEKKKTIDGPIIVEGKEGEVGPQLGAFRYMYEKLAYGDRSQYGERQTNEFYSYAHLLESLLKSIKRKAEKEIRSFEENSACKGIFGRIDDWFFRKLVVRPGTPGWYDQVINTAKATIVEIGKAVEIIKERFGSEDGK